MKKCCVLVALVAFTMAATGCGDKPEVKHSTPANDPMKDINIKDKKAK